MKTLFKPAGIAVALLIATPSLGFALGIETLPPVLSVPDPRTILVADDDADRPFWWRNGQHTWQGGDDDWDDDDDDRWDDDDDD